MKIADARYLADKLIDHTFTIDGREYCARDIGYKFEWMTRKRTLGLCNYSRKVIYLSEDYVFNNIVELVEDTIRHELAHAFSHFIYGYVGVGHNRYWRHCCVQVGANPQRCKSKDDGLVQAAGKYILRHTETHEVYSNYYKWPSKTYENCKQGLIWIRGKKRETMGKLEVVVNDSTMTI